MLPALLFENLRDDAVAEVVSVPCEVGGLEASAEQGESYWNGRHEEWPLEFVPQPEAASPEPIDAHLGLAAALESRVDPEFHGFPPSGFTLA
jgi:hypothetical protein